MSAMSLRGFVSPLGGPAGAYLPPFRERHGLHRQGVDPRQNSVSWHVPCCGRPLSRNALRGCAAVSLTEQKTIGRAGCMVLRCFRVAL